MKIYHLKFLRNHGLLTVGETIEEAVNWFYVLDRACQVQLLADAAAQGRGGETVKITHEEAAYTRGVAGSHKGKFLWIHSCRHRTYSEDKAAGCKAPSRSTQRSYDLNTRTRDSLGPDTTAASAPEEVGPNVSEPYLSTLGALAKSGASSVKVASELSVAMVSLLPGVLDGGSLEPFRRLDCTILVIL